MRDVPTATKKQRQLGKIKEGDDVRRLVVVMVDCDVVEKTIK